jgi:hypothetical protein
VKPLNKQSSQQLLQRILNGTDSELRSITVLDPTTMQLRMSVQDKNRGFDWLDMIFEVSGISNAQLVDDAKLVYVDMTEGISILFDGDRVGLGVGEYVSVDALESSPLFFIGSGIKYAETDFSG